MEAGLSPDQRGKHNNCRPDSPGPQEPPDPDLELPCSERRYYYYENTVIISVSAMSVRTHGCPESVQSGAKSPSVLSVPAP